MARPTGADGAKTADRAREVALKLFAEQGYAAASMRDIASQIGVRASALYNHFPAKQDILVDLLESHMTRLIGAWQERAAGLRDASPAMRLSQFVRFHITFHIDRRDAVFLSYMELRNLEPDNFARMEKLRQHYEGFLDEILRDGVAAGGFKIRDVHVTTMAIISMLVGLNNWFRDTGRLGVDEISDIFDELVAGAVGINQGVLENKKHQEERFEDV